MAQQQIRMLKPLHESSAIEEVGWIKQGGFLCVRFKGQGNVQQGATYGYSGVPWRLAYGLLISRSAGRFYNKEIRGKFEAIGWLAR